MAHLPHGICANRERNNSTGDRSGGGEGEDFSGTLLRALACSPSVGRIPHPSRSRRFRRVTQAQPISREELSHVDHIFEVRWFNQEGIGSKFVSQICVTHIVRSL